MSPKDVWRILLAAALIGALLVLGSMFVDQGRLLASVACGAVLGTLNLYWLIRVGQQLLSDKPSKRALLLRFALKYLVMGGLILFVFVVLEVDALGFLLGISNIVGGVLLYSSGLLGHSAVAPD